MPGRQSAFTLLLLFLFTYHATLAQSNEKVLFIIDSIPVFTDPEPWDDLDGEDVSDITVVKNKDSLKARGWEKMDGIIYVFTKAYRSRPDSIKKIPSLKQMLLKEQSWHLHDTPYSGRYIDYYNNGNIQNEGVLLNGKPEGELIVYFKNGSKKSTLNYHIGVLHGYWKDYYKNEQLMQARQYDNGREMRGSKTYFINGQLQHEVRVKKETRYDTAVEYYSNGKIRKMKVSQTGEFHPSSNEHDLNKYTTAFYSYMNAGNLKQANRNLYQIWRRDSTNIDTYFKEGLLAFKEQRFDAAIASLNKALDIEPLMRESLVYRGLACIKKYTIPEAKLYTPQNEEPLTLEALLAVPEAAQCLICADLIKAEETDQGEVYVRKLVPPAILKYCREKSR
ncbi:MAG: hypothetical protein KF862_04860 [Chitinophagaceae bacterium]|nr:hypothetical protein [Chitinophagaceae bacterium]